MITLPEQILFNVLRAGLETYKSDYNASSNKDDSLISQMFKGIIIDGFDFYAQAKNLILRNQSDPNQVKLRMFFDLSAAALPTIHITLPSEVPGANGIGFDAGFEENFQTQDGLEEGFTYTRSFNTTFEIVCTSANTFEVLTLYNIVKSIFIIAINSFELSGLQNIKLSGSDLRLPEGFESFPFYGRTLRVDLMYDYSIRELYLKQTIKDVFLENLTTLMGDEEFTPSDQLIKINEDGE